MRRAILVSMIAIFCLFSFSGLVSATSGIQSQFFAETTLGSAIYQGTSSFLQSQAATLHQASRATIDMNRQGGQMSVASNAFPGLSIPSVKPTRIESGKSSFNGFIGLTALDSANVNAHLTYTPPDQALCTDGSYVMEAINTAITVYTTQGIQVVQTVSLNPFFKLRLLEFTSDPRCFFDTTTHRWFIAQLQIQENKKFTNFTGNSYFDVAVSATANPLGKYFIYLVPTTDDGSMNTPVHKGCPCFGDMPLIGLDQYGFYVSTNEYTVFGNGYNGAQIYALDKAGLESGSHHPMIVHINAAPLLSSHGGLAYTIQPAMNSPGQAFVKNTELFISALAFHGFDTRLVIWALFGTNTLSSNHPGLHLSYSLFSTETYGVPGGWDGTFNFKAAQPNGPRPLAHLLAECKPPENIPGCGPKNNLLETLAADDARLEMVTYADNYLWTGLNTLLKTTTGQVHDGIAWFIVSPKISTLSISGSIVNQGYIAAPNADVIYPSVVANNGGEGAVSFTVTGHTIFPSSAYSTISVKGNGPIQIVALGNRPLDDLSGYPAYGGNGVARWGDYSWAVAAPNGHIWIASEYVSNTPRTYLSNFGTFVCDVAVS